MAMSGPDRTLVALRALGLGDLLTATPALRGLARAHPRHRLVLAGPAALAPILRRIDRRWTLAPRSGLEADEERLPIAVDLAVNLHGRGPQSHHLLLRSRPLRLFAFECPELAIDGPRWEPVEHEVMRWCRLVTETTGARCDPSDLILDGAAAMRRRSHHGATLIHPGAASVARRWPVSRWVEVARAEADAGRTVILTGSAAERSLTLAVQRQAGLPTWANLAGRTGIAQLAELVAGAARVACGDTGIAHLATALNVPSVVLFGPTPPSEWGPAAAPGPAAHIVLWAGLRGDPHANAPDAGLLQIEVADVISALERLPGAESRTSTRRTGATRSAVAVAASFF